MTVVRVRSRRPRARTRPGGNVERHHVDAAPDQMLPGACRTRLKSSHCPSGPLQTGLPPVDTLARRLVLIGSVRVHDAVIRAEVGLRVGARLTAEP